MTELEFKILLHEKLCDLADLFLYYYKPCGIKNGKCLTGSFPCCIGSRFTQNSNEKCHFLGLYGCKFKNVECKVYLCNKAFIKANVNCIKSLEAINTIAKIYVLTTEK